MITKLMKFVSNLIKRMRMIIDPEPFSVKVYGVNYLQTTG